MTDEDTNPLYLAGIECFNRGDYFDSHEVWEDLWNETRGPSRDFLKGLIQAAVCLHHLGNGNWHGTTKLLGSSRGYLFPYQPVYWGLDVGAFLQSMAETVAAARAAADPATAESPRAGGPQIRLEGTATHISQAGDTPRECDGSV